MEIFFLSMTLLAGAIMGFLSSRVYSHYYPENSYETEMLRKQVQELKVKKQVIDEQLILRTKEIDSLKIDLKENHQNIVELTGKLSTVKSENAFLNEKLLDQKKELDAIREKFVFEFKSLANEILIKESAVFTAQNKTNLEAVLKPLSEKISGFEKKVDEVYDRESKQRFSLKEEVKRLAELNTQISRDAQSLVSALKGQSKTQGDWGELILENILERSGLVKGREFITQKSYKAGDGKRLQPDVILTLPGSKNVVVDSKVSLTAYEIFASQTDELAQQEALKNHLISVRKHIDELAAKNYQLIYEINSLDFVILFMPIEPAFLVAIQHDQDLWNYAYQKGVLLIGPTNLVATLKMVASLWQQEYQNRNVLEIASESGKLYDKFVGFVKDIQDIGDKLSASQNAYDKALNKLSTGRGNLVSKAQKIKTLGAKTTKEIPPLLLDDQNESLSS